MEVRVVRGEFTTVSVHSTGDFASLLVAPSEGGKVCFVVHKTAVKVGIDVGTGRFDVDLMHVKGDMGMNIGIDILCHDSPDIPENNESK